MVLLLDNIRFIAVFVFFIFMKQYYCPKNSTDHDVILFLGVWFVIPTINIFRLLSKIKVENNINTHIWMNWIPISELVVIFFTNKHIFFSVAYIGEINDHFTLIKFRFYPALLQDGIGDFNIRARLYNNAHFYF